ncbi:MAG: glycosyltransferase [Actinomycetota bacterium]|nr:glycosyltransferase [Actinomycetota bacterium]
MPTVSIVIPTYNRVHLLGRTLRAALGQDGVDLEVVVVDDGSSDGILEAITAADDGRIRLLRNPAPTGVSAARNRGISAASGDWIAFLDDDDLWAPDKLVSQLTAAERAGARWAYAGDVNINDRLQVLSGAPPPDPETVLALLPRLNPLGSGGSNVVVRSELLRAVGGFDPSLNRTEDWDLWIRLGRAGVPAWVPRPLVAYRFHSGNVAADPDGMVDEPRRLADRYAIPVDLAAMHRRAAWTALRAGRRGLAVRYYAGAVVRGDLLSVGRAAIGLVHPAVGTDRLFGLLRRDPDWVAAAKRWLTAFTADAPAREQSAP